MAFHKWHEPEASKSWLSRGRFVVYVLNTANGHYVGHTGNLKQRLNKHYSNKVPSTKFSGPRLLWKSKVFSSRESASKYEAALKSWRDSRSKIYTHKTGLQPVPWVNRSNKPYVQQKTSQVKFTGSKKARRSQPYIKRARRRRFK